MYLRRRSEGGGMRLESLKDAQIIVSARNGPTKVEKNITSAFDNRLNASAKLRPSVCALKMRVKFYTKMTK